MFVVVQDSKGNKGRRKEETNSWCEMFKDSIELEWDEISLLGEYRLEYIKLDHLL